MWTLKEIIKLVDESKDESTNDMTKIAYSLPITVCSLYVAHMKLKHNIVIPI